ncbi:hypothetical protein [Roseitalea porphyridii]|uniref:Uncharacterized protein n=1 Tax=Roseitalea porphyridii TaxID=1852022 RepID=A0A4P6UXK9_9HYPH|nr:hypothetical protein [Roseitalea porphyridii]QBK29801.1 hypothetical protein E0E05_03810 [Roseitalea porphyridii]
MLFQLRQPLLIGFDGGRTLGIDDAIDKLFNLAVGFDDVTANCFLAFFCLPQANVPCLLEHGPGHLEDRLGGAEFAQQFFEVRFEPVARNGFAMAFAFPIVAEIIGVTFAGLALRPAGRERFVAVTT